MSSEAQRAAKPMRERSSAQEVTLAQRYTELYEQYFEFVWRSARYLGEPPSSLDDAVQDVFLVAYRRFQDFEARSSPRTWLFAITLRVVSDHRRSRRRKTRLLDSVKRMFTGTTPTPFDHASHAERSRTLVAALEALNDDQRAVFVMADIEELSAPEIASVLSVNLNTVYSRLRTARREIAARLVQTPGSEPGNKP
ncbi:MAG TPA: sigma-70 family RNA polymerase sigma factor [Polyangiales bacterium]|nr:sigma-70 family RNA polymerase sigma factor [Polyangiales bacterium]